MHTTYNVTGMTCGHCELSVQEELIELHGVTAVNANHESGEVVVESERELPIDEVRAAVESAGYTLSA